MIRLLSRKFAWALIALFSFGVAAEAQTRPAAAPAGRKAGNVSALLPVAKITRGIGQTRSVTEAKKGDEVQWQDLIQTEKGGRARILLEDQSVISLGSQAELRIMQHNRASQQTSMQLTYGRVRMQVASITRDGGRFELRTPTAVAGVIGTDFGTDSSLPGVTQFICITGIVSVANEDSRVPGSVQCPAGTTTTVNRGMAPTPPQPATQQQIRQLIQDTEPAVISSFSPGSALLGTEIVSNVSGSKMAGIESVTISGEGVTVALQGQPTDTSVAVRINVTATATPGTRTITFTKANGQSTAAVFSLLAPPKAGETVNFDELKKAYLAIFEEEKETAISGVNAVGVGAQQEAEAVAQAIAAENNKLQPPLDPAKVDADLKADSEPLLQAMNTAGASINEEAARAARDLDAALVALQARLAVQQPAPTEAAKAEAIKDVFELQNGGLLKRFEAIQAAVARAAQGVAPRFQATQQRWLDAVKVESARQKSLPIPKVDADERSYDVGQIAVFDATRSTGSAGAALTGFSWVLCDPGYKPQQVGVPIASSDARCRPLAGYAGTSPEFRFQTCMLAPQDYIARVTIMDAANKSAAMDVRLRVLPPQYESPSERLRSLADAYQNLQPNSFSLFFDESYTGLTELQENIRRTFAALASMSINLRLSQASLGCNEATVRADWDQNYTFKEDQTCVGAPLGSDCQRVVFKQSEQLTVRMKRVPGKNWFITDFQGNNGTVQGSPPGPIQRDTSLPDFRVTSLTALNGSTSLNSSAIGITPGENHFVATLTNVGTASALSPVRVRFAINNDAGQEIASDLREVTALPIGGSASVTGILNIPDLGQTAQARVFATANPGCTITEQNCDGANSTLLDVIVGNVDLAVTSATQIGTLIGTQAGQVDVVVSNVGSRSSSATFGNLRILSGTLLIGSANIPAMAAGASVTIPVTITAPNLAGTQPISVTISPASPGDLNLVNNTLAGSLNITQAFVNVKIAGLAYSGSSGPFLSGQSVTVTANLLNTGNRPTSSVFFACRLTGTPGTVNFFQQSVPIMPAGGSITGLTYTFTMPANFAGANTLECGATQDPFEAAGTIGDNSSTLALTANINVDLRIVNLPAANTPFQMTSAANYLFGILNAGGDTVPAGWDIVLTVNGNPVGTFTSTAPLNGFATLPVAVPFTVPAPAPAPADISGVPVIVHVNANAAATETNPTNNIVNTTFRLVDFTLTVIPTGPLTGVSTRGFTATAVQVNPPTYPLGIFMNYTGAPTGLVTTGPNLTTLAGTITSAPGSFTVGATGTVAGVSRSTAGTFGINVVPEVTITPGTPPSLTAAPGGGPAQPVAVNIAGGIYPLGLSFLQPTGIAITGPNTLGAAGSVNYNLSADSIATSGANFFSLTVSDPGNANVPPKVFTANVPYNVVGFVDQAIQPFVFSVGGPYVSGQNISVNVIVQNLGNSPTNAANTYSCQHNGTPGILPITSGSVPVIAPQSSVTIPVNFVMPPNRAPLSIFECTVSQDPQEATADLNNNFRSLNLTVNQNIDLQVTSITAPAANQMGGTAALSITVKNFGLDTAGSGWDVGARINGSPVGTPGTGGTLAGGASVTFTPTVPVPQIGTAPTNSGNYSLEGFVNANNAVTETNLGNNILANTINLVDFRLVQASAGGTIVVGRPLGLVPAVQVDPATYSLALTVNYTGLPAGLAGSGAPHGQNVTGTATATGSATITADATVNGVTRAMPGNIPLTINADISLSLVSFNPLNSGGAAEPLTINVTGGIYPVTVTLPPLPTGITTTSPASVVLGAPGNVTWNLQAGLNSSPGAFNLLIAAGDNGSTPTNTAAGSASLNVPGSVTGQSNYILTGAAFAAPHASGTGADSLQVGETAVVNFTAQNIGNLTQAGTLTVELLTSCGGPFSTTVAAPSANGGSVSGSVSHPVACAPGAYSYTLTITAAPAETSTADNSVGPFNYQVFDFDVVNTSSFNPQNIRMGSTGTYSLNLTQTGPAAPISLPLSVTNGGRATTTPSGTVSSFGGATTVVVTNSGAAVSGDNETIQTSITRLGITKSATHAVRFYTAQVDNISPGQPGSTTSNPVSLGINQSAQTVDFRLVGTFAGSATFVVPVVSGFNINLVGPAPTLPNDTFTLSIQAITGAPTTVTAIPIVFNIPNTNPAQTVSTSLFVGAFSPPSITVNAPVGTGIRFGGRSFSTFPLLSGEAGDLNVTVNNIGNGPSTAGLGLRVRLGGPSGPVINTSTLTVPAIAANSSTTVVAHVRAPEPLSDGTSSFYVEVDPDPREANSADNNNSLAIKTADWSLAVIGAGNPGSELQIVIPDQSSADGTLGIVVNGGNVYAPIPVSLGEAPSFVNVLTPDAVGISTGFTLSVQGNPLPDIYQVNFTATMKDGTLTTAQRNVTVFLQISGGGVFATAKEPGEPDVQLKSTDVSISPSIPRAGDMLDVRFKVTNAGEGEATAVPVALMVNGAVVATESYTLKAGASTLGGFQYQIPGDGADLSERPARRPSNKQGAELDGDIPRGPARRSGVAVQLMVDPAATVKQKSTQNKVVVLAKGVLGAPLDVAPSPVERVYLEMSTICAGFRPSSGVIGDCEGGAELDIAIEDLGNSRYAMNALYGVADLGNVEIATASASGAQFTSRLNLTLGHTYAVQLSADRVAYVRFSASLTPRQLAAEARRRFGANAIRILRKLGGDTGGVQAGDVSGNISADALMYFDMSFRMPR